MVGNIAARSAQGDDRQVFGRGGNVVGLDRNSINLNKNPINLTLSIQGNLGFLRKSGLAAVQVM